MNTINLIGRTTADPELRYTPGGTPVCAVRLAVNVPPRDGKEQPAVFIDVITFGAQAEALAAHVRKGRQLGVTGRLNYRQWEADGRLHPLQARGDRQPGRVPGQAGHGRRYGQRARPGPRRRRLRRAGVTHQKKRPPPRGGGRFHHPLFATGIGALQETHVTGTNHRTSVTGDHAGFRHRRTNTPAY